MTISIGVEQKNLTGNIISGETEAKQKLDE